MLDVIKAEEIELFILFSGIAWAQTRNLLQCLTWMPNLSSEAMRKRVGEEEQEEVV